MKALKAIVSSFIFLVVCSSSLNAQSANTLLSEVAEKVKSYENISIDFNYELSNTAANSKEETRGSVKLQDDKYVLDLFGGKVLFDGAKMYQISAEDEEINISSPSSDETLTPSNMLTFFEKGYNATMDIEQNVQGRKIQYVKLVPTNGGDEFKYILLGIDKQTKHIYNQIISQANGSEITITVTNFKTNQPLSSTLFQFEKSKYSGYYINNLDE